MPKLTVKPIGDRIICTPAQAETKSAGGIHLPGNDKMPRGTVLAVGAKLFVDWEQVGDHVISRPPSHLPEFMVLRQ